MGYRIDYSGGQALHRRITFRKEHRWRPIIVVFTLLLLLIGSVREKIYHLLIPGNDDVTIHAFRELVSSLQEGGSVPDALEVFCQEIIFEEA